MANRKPHTRQAKKRMSDAHKGHIVSEKTKELLRTYRLGVKHSEETKAKMSQIKTNRPFLRPREKR